MSTKLNEIFEPGFIRCSDTIHVHAFTCSLSLSHSIRFSERVKSEFFQCIRPNYLISNVKLAYRFPAWIAGGASYSSSSKLESHEFRCLISRNNKHKTLISKYQNISPIRQLTDLLIRLPCSSHLDDSRGELRVLPWYEVYGLHSNVRSYLLEGQIDVDLCHGGAGWLKWSWSECKQNPPNRDRNDRIEGWTGGRVEGWRDRRLHSHSIDFSFGF